MSKMTHREMANALMDGGLSVSELKLFFTTCDKRAHRPLLQKVHQQAARLRKSLSAQGATKPDAQVVANVLRKNGVSGRALIEYFGENNPVAHPVIAHVLRLELEEVARLQSTAAV